MFGSNNFLGKKLSGGVQLFGLGLAAKYAFVKELFKIFVCSQTTLFKKVIVISPLKRTFCENDLSVKELKKLHYLPLNYIHKILLL